jgi:diamine N-acetyltransferase
MNSGNLKLRTPEPTDIDLLYAWENDTEIWHLGNTRVPFSKFDLEQYVLNSGRDIYANKQARFMIDLSEGSKTKTIGCIDLYDYDPSNHRAGVGILISQDYRQKGIASYARTIKPA